ncbi:MAG: hypothetical protein K8R60_03135 [Burkholderiales bacterium]|nr:hypothetical protein [Burkholderiales bacterium]
MPLRASREDGRALDSRFAAMMTTRQAAATFAWLALFALIALLGIAG